MNDELKAVRNLGAELGAAKAEVARLRGLLREAAHCCPDEQLRNEMKAALSQQAEPVEPVEPAPAQDEQYPPCDYCGVIPDHHPWHGSGMFNGEDSPHIHACNDCRHLLPTRPAQTEQQPVSVPEGWLIELGFDVLDRPFRFVDSKSHTPTIKVILPACEPDDSSSWFLRDEIARRIGSVLAAPIAQTAPQGKFRMGDRVKKSSGSEWEGRVVGTYSTEQTPEGYAVESAAHKGSVQIYPAKALEAVE